MKIAIKEIEAEDITKIFEGIKQNKSYVLNNSYDPNFVKNISDAFMEEMLKLVNKPKTL